MISNRYLLTTTPRIYECQLCDYKASGEHQNTILTHLQDKHGISRNSAVFRDYLDEHFDLPSCACGCGGKVDLRRKGLILNLFAKACKNKSRFVNPKFAEFYLFAGQTANQAIESVRKHQAGLASRAATGVHLKHLSRINSGDSNPASLKSVVARTGQDSQTALEVMRERSRGERNGFYGKRHTPETKRHLARLRASQAKTVSKPELAVWGMLHALGIAFQYQVPIQEYVVDFVVGDLVIEVYGDYWHGPKMSPSKRARDDLKLVRLKESGYDVLVIMESDVFTRPERVVNTLKGLANSEAQV